MEKIVQIPDWFEIGRRFSGRWIKGLECTVISYDIVKNKAKVKIEPTDPNRSYWHEDWDLLHTLYGFERGDYSYLDVKT